jgi:ribosome recycling factor
MFEDILAEMQSSMKRAVENLQRELAKTRTGRANPAVLDGVRVEYYGAPTPLNQVAAITVADPRLITVKPWDRKLVGPIERSIIQSDLGLNPSNDGEIVRIPIPPLTQERRDDLCRQVRKQGEESKVAIRNIRRDSNELIKSEEGVSEDVVLRTLKVVQDHTDKYVKSIDEIVSKKEEEIQEV